MIFLKVRNVLWRTVFVVFIIISLSACLPLQNEPEETDGTEEQTPTVTAPEVQVEANYYRSVYPYISSETRGTIQSYLGEYRFDADRLELGLVDVAQDYYS